MSSSNNLFVKFVPWNENTLSGLINKTVKFSTVFEFNDFNEFSCIASSDDQIEEGKLYLKQKFHETKFRNHLLQLLKTGDLHGLVSPYRENMLHATEKGDFEMAWENGKNIMERNAVFSLVGIFCISGIDVFEDDGAQLMFAHYAQNLKGIALVYDADAAINLNKMKGVDYTPKSWSFANIDDCINNFEKEEFNFVSDFLNKSDKWSYENEKRIFGKPGITKADDVGLKLKAILYTTKFADADTLKKINESLYGNMISIGRIVPDRSLCKFIMDNKTEVIEFLCGKSND